jgi:hypothetical protein
MEENMSDFKKTLKEDLMDIYEEIGRPLLWCVAVLAALWFLGLFI